MKKTFLLLSLFFVLQSYAQAPKLSQEAAISVFTCGKGAELYSTFGHTAIRIKDSVNNIDVVYNYGAFDFDTEHFYLKFVKGDLQYFIIASSYADFIYEYQYDNREVIEQTLNLSYTQKEQLFELLNQSLFSEDRYYTYKFIDRNCTTMVMDKINQTIGKTILKKVDDQSISYRSVLYPYFEDHFWYKLGINIIFGAKTDSKAEKLFLPIELLNSLDQAKINGKPLVAKKAVIVPGVAINSGFSFFNSIYFIAVILLVIVLVNKKPVTLTYLFLLGLLGLFLSFVGLYSFHKEVLWNYNSLLFNPIFLVLPFVKGKKLNLVLKACLVMMAAYTLFLFNKADFFLMFPFILSNGVLMYRLLKKQQ